MATFKAVVLKHQLRRDGLYPVSIRITQNRRSVYVSTGVYVEQKQINKKTFEIKDQFVLNRMCQTINRYRDALLTIDTESLRVMTAEDVRELFSGTSKEIDYLEYCRELIYKDAYKWSALKSALCVIEEMGIKRMMVTDFTSRFLYRYKRCLDEKTLPNGQHYKSRTKNSYLIALNQVFRMICKDVNTEFRKVVSHDPFVGFEYYKDDAVEKKSLTRDELREFFAIEPKTDAMKRAQDMMMISFCLCGINMIDLLTMGKECLDSKNKRITYNRRKTRGVRADNALSSVQIEPEIYFLIEKYKNKTSDNRLFDFGFSPDKNGVRTIGMMIDRMCKMNDFRHVSPYAFRHSWATIARNDCDISKDDIDLCLNHVGQNKMADVYIRTDWSRIDKANRKVLDFVF